MTFVMRSTAVVTKASSASAGRMSMHSYSLNVHLLWSGRPPLEGEQKGNEGCPAVYGNGLSVDAERWRLPAPSTRPGYAAVRSARWYR